MPHTPTTTTIIVGALMVIATALFCVAAYFVIKYALRFVGKMFSFVNEVANIVRERKDRYLVGPVWGWDIQDRIEEWDKPDEEWSVMVEGAAGYGEEFLERVARRALDENIPRLVVRKRIVWPYLRRKWQPVLVITNKKIKGYQMLIDATDYTDRLDVWWRVDKGDRDQLPLRGAEIREKRFGLDSSGVLEAQAQQEKNWVFPEQMTALDKQEWDNCTGLVRDIVRAEVKRMADEVRIGGGVAGGAKGFIDIN